MLDTIINTKIRIPSLRRGLVSRKRLLDRLNAGLEKRITLISAPAGCGKTSLLCEWIANHPAKSTFAWVSLDESDNDLGLFLQYLVAALQTIDPEVGQGILPILQSPNPPKPDIVLPALINQINLCEPKIVLVLDDYHLITEPAVHKMTIQLIKRGDPGVHLVLSSRADPPLPVYRYRAQGMLSEIRQADLNFTLAEAQQLLRYMVGEGLKTEDIELLYQRTEGWAVGLFLTGLSLVESPDISEAVTALSGNQIYIMEYLTNEVINRQPPKIRDFLLLTAILRKMTGPLCDELTNQDDGTQTLAYLVSKNLFVSALDHEGIWYRYHQLFSDLLHRQLEREHKEQIPHLHRAASNWYLQNGFLVDGIAHAIATGDYGAALDLIDESAEKLWARGEQARLLRQLQSLPLDIFQNSVIACLWTAIFLFFDGKREDAQILIARAESLVGENPDFKGQYQHELAGIKALFAAQLALIELDMDQVVTLARCSLEKLPEKRKMLRQVVKIILADSLSYRGDTEEGQRAYTELLALNTVQKNPVLLFSIAVRFIFSLQSSGQLHRAYDLGLKKLTQLGKIRPKLPLLVEGNLRVALGEILVEWNRLDEARDHFDQACEIYDIDTGETAEALYLRMVRGYLALGLIARAERIVSLVETALKSGNIPQPNLGSVLSHKARLHLYAGNHAEAEKVLSKLDPVDPWELIFPNETAYLMIIRVWLARGKYQAAAEMLEALQDQFERGMRTHRLIEALILRAKLEVMQRRYQCAMTTLARALTLAEPQGFIRLFIDGGEEIHNLLSQRISHGDRSSYLYTLVAAFEEPPHEIQPTDIPTGLVEVISEREQQVLRLLRTHLSQQEIADELYVSVNTIRFHTKNIYRKLGVHQRSEAVEKAKSAGML